MFVGVFFSLIFESFYCGSLLGTVFLPGVPLDSQRSETPNPNTEFSFHFRNRAAEMAAEDENRLL